MSRVNAHVARRFLEQALQALEGDQDALREAMRGPLGRSVQLHREVAGSLEDPVDTSESSLTLLEWWLESIGAMEPETEQSWVETPDEDATLKIPAPAAAVSPNGWPG